MSDYIEYEGKNVDDALEKASVELNQAIEKITYDILSHGSSGIFGLVGVKKAKIRVKTLVDGGSVVSIEDEARAKARDMVKDAFKIEDVKKTPKPNGIPKPAEADIDKAIENGMAVLQKIVEAISPDTTIRADNQDERLVFKIEGGNSALLIGKRGQTLEAIQYLAEKIINKQNDSRVRVLVDVEGYLDTRKSNLKKLASRMAEKAKRINKPVTIGQMNAYDRRIVHLHLKENQAVRTQSVGEGYYRKLVIFPKRKRRQKSEAS